MFRLTTQPQWFASSKPAASLSGKLIATSLRWVHQPKTPHSDRCGTRPRWIEFPADRVADRPRQWRRVRPWSRLAPIPAARFDNLRDFAAGGGGPPKFGERWGGEGGRARGAPGPL